MSVAAVNMDGVSPAHRFEPAALVENLRRRLPEFGDDLVVEQIQGGVSNPTLMLRTTTDEGPRRYVLRKKPPGVLLKGAHQVDREARVMQALRETDVPVPNVRYLEHDASIIGTEFYVMDFLDGRIFRDARLPGMVPEERAAIFDELNAVLARLHNVDHLAAGLGDYGPPGNYYERQFNRWSKQYRAAETGHLPAMEQLMRELGSAIPEETEVAIAHGDYRLENVMFHATEPRIVAVLDWELSTLGQPLADLAYNCFLWHSHEPGWGTLDGIDLAASGIPSEAEYVEAYFRRTGRSDVRGSDWNYYLAFAIFRLASINQGVFMRSLKGNISSDREIVNQTDGLAAQALDILHR